MRKRRRSAINFDNYREWAEREGALFEREVASKADSSRLLNMAAGIGNMYAEFGDIDGAKPWFVRALEIARSRCSDPTQTRVYMLWRMGDQEGLEEECRALIAHRSARANELTLQLATAVEADRHDVIRQLGLAYLSIATGHLYLREFREARLVAIRAESEAPFGHETKIIGAVAEALVGQDQVAYEKALRSSRGRVLEWPTFESDSAVNLYRLTVALGKEYFGSIPTDLQEELRDREP